MVITDKIWEQLFPTIEKGQEFITREDLEKGIQNNTYQLFTAKEPDMTHNNINFLRNQMNLSLLN